MRRLSKYSPHLMTISETSTIAIATKERDGSKATSPSPSPSPPSSHEVGATTKTESEDADQRQRIERSQSAPPEVERDVAEASPSSSSSSSSQSPLPRSRSSTDVRESSRTARGSSSSKYGRSALHNAVRKGDKSTIARLLADQPGLLREPDARGNLPLHYAANPQVPHHAEVMYMLLRAGSPVNVLNARGQSALVVFVISTETDADLVPRMLLHYHARPAVRVTDEQMLAPYATARGLRQVAAALREFM